METIPHFFHKRDNQFNRSKPRVSRPNEYWGIDMTKVMISSFGWLYVVLDWYTKKIADYSLSSHSKTDDWLMPLIMAVIINFQKVNYQSRTILL